MVRTATYPVATGLSRGLLSVGRGAARRVEFRDPDPSVVYSAPTSLTWISTHAEAAVWAVAALTRFLLRR